jgi:hypothetical protein
MQTKSHRRRQLSALAVCLGLIAALLLPTAVAARALSQPNQDPADYLTQTLAAFGEKPDGEYNRRNVYAYDLSPSGYEYTFTVNGEPAYALMTYFTTPNGDLYHDITEMFFNTPSPFAQAKGLPVYIDKFVYFYYFNDTYTDLTDNSVAEYSALAIAAEQSDIYGEYSDGGTSSTDIISYAFRSKDSYEFEYGLPGYYASNHVNTCANIAGGNVLGYYDIFYPNLIPNHETLYEYNGKYYYKVQSDEVTSIISNDLYKYMQTSEQNGTTFENFKSGLKKYVNQQGYNAEYYETVENHKLDIGAYLTEIYMGHPVAVFMAGYNITDGPFFDDGYDKVYLAYYKTMHAMAASGFMEIEYYNSANVMFRKDSYLSVCTGNTWIKRGYMRLNDKETFNHAIGIEIY